MSCVVAVDFDETITDNTPWPMIGKVRPEAVICLRRLRDAGCTLVLWTARREPWYSECIDFLKREGLHGLFDFSYCERGATGKLIANYYIDDRGIFGRLDWNNICDYILSRLGKEGI